MTAEKTNAANSDQKPRPGIRKVVRWAEHLLASIGLTFIIYHSAFEITAMTSDSMAPTLQGTSYENGDRIVFERVSGWFRAPKRWEIYHYSDPDGNNVAKRVIGLPNEKISLKNNRIYVNGVELQRPAQLKAIKYYDYGTLANGRQVDCGTGYFMLGDSSIDSQDSRYTGPVGGKQFRGRAWCILWPYSRLGFIN